MTYRAQAVTQRDGSALASSNCRMAAGCDGLDYQTGGRKTSTGEEMRSRQGDQSGGTDAHDLAAAWATYGEQLTIVSGGSWSGAEADLRAGRLVMLDVWAASVGGPCLSGSGAYGHTIAVAPEASGTRWLVGDPWCSPPSWQWWEASRLASGAEEWGSRVSREVGASNWSGVPAAILSAIVRELMTRWRPDAPATGEDAETHGAKGGPILYTRTAAAGGSSSGGTDEMRFIQANGYGVETGLRVNVGAGASWYYLDGAKGGTIANDAALRVVGLPDSTGGQYAVVLGTGTPYADKSPRDTVVFIKTSNATYPAPTPPPDPDAGGDLDEAAIRDERDEEWRAWLLAGSPGEAPS